MAADQGAGLINQRCCYVAVGSPCSTSVPWGTSTAGQQNSRRGAGQAEKSTRSHSRRGGSQRRNTAPGREVKPQRQQTRRKPEAKHSARQKRQAAVHKGGITHASRGVMHSHDTAESRSRRDSSHGRRETSLRVGAANGAGCPRGLDEPYPFVRVPGEALTSPTHQATAPGTEEDRE